MEVALQRLKSEARSMDEALSAGGRVTHPVRVEVASSVADVVTMGALLCEVHAAAVEVHAELTSFVSRSPSTWLGRRQAEELQDVPFEEWGPIMERHVEESRAAGVFEYLDELGRRMGEPDPATDRLKVLFKAWLFLVRVLQDDLYRVLWEQETGSPAGGRSSMQLALNDRNPVGIVIRRDASGYLEWFEELRATRNRLKRGVSFFIAGPDEDLGLGFVGVTGEGGVVSDLAGQVLRLSDAEAAVEASRGLVELGLRRASSD